MNQTIFQLKKAQNNNIIPQSGPMKSVTGIVVFRLGDSGTNNLDSNSVDITNGYNSRDAVSNYAGI
jgi:hypothetical protein